jgi:hypothetical protein
MRTLLTRADIERAAVPVTWVADTNAAVPHPRTGLLTRLNFKSYHARHVYDVIVKLATVAREYWIFVVPPEEYNTVPDEQVYPQDENGNVALPPNCVDYRPVLKFALVARSPDVGGTFAERKRLGSYRGCAVIIPDGELGCDRVVAYHSNVEDAEQSRARYPGYTHAKLYVRHDPPSEPVAGDFQI